MKQENIHEGCIEQIQRLFQKRLYTGEAVQTDEKGRIRIDDLEMLPIVQNQVADLWIKATTENLSKIGDLDGYRKDFYNLFGFEYKGVDYKKDANEMVGITSIA